jgi:exodeoxyribonuclease V beta subunit
MNIPAMRPYAFDEDLPRGVLAIQASAGTGKTYALVDLAVRFIAEKDIRASQLLIVTFTRAATGELRSRLRERLVEVAGVLASEHPETKDPFLDFVAADERIIRLGRVQRAVSEFDSATITTIHGFATQMLGTLGSTSGTDPDARLVDDADDLVADTCADQLAAAAADETVSYEDLPTLREFVNATERAMSCPDTKIVPGVDQQGAQPAQVRLAQMVEEARRTIVHRHRRAATMSYDDLLTQLRQALNGPGGVATVQAIRERFAVALIDEFQDTDPVQWDIFARLFGDDEGTASLVLVGDPKQAIFAFRGANVHTFVKAVDEPGTEQRALETNWRSDGALISALDILFEGATFGEESIAFERVTVARDNAGKRLVGATGGELPALSLRLALGSTLPRNKHRGSAPTGREPIAADGARSSIFADLVIQVRELLESATLPPKDGESRRPVQPSDVAVLVRTNIEAAQVQTALIAQDIPAVLSRGMSVLQAPAADQWRSLLDALMRPSNTERARAFALSWFAGWNAARIDAAVDADLAGLQEQLQSWSETLTNHGVAPFVQKVMVDSGVVARVLHRPDGDRQVTDLEHIGELLQAAPLTQRPSVAGLLSMLDTEPDDDADVDTKGDRTARRIESEAQAVQIMTVWVAKGLQFPIVCVPTMWSKAAADVMYQDPLTGDRTYDVAKGEDWPTKKEAKVRKGWAAEESLGEHLRLLYVALTRAQHHTIVWWTRSLGSEKSSLAHLLFARTDDGAIDVDKYCLEKVDEFPPDQDAEDFLEPLARRSEGKISVTTIGATRSPPDRWIPSAPSAVLGELTLAHLDSVPDRSLRRWSFTAITHMTEVADFDPFDSSLSDRAAGDEAAVTDGASTSVPVEAEAPETDTLPMSAMALLPAGPAFGTLVHSVLEGVDFVADDLRLSLQQAVNRELARTPMDLTPTSLPGLASASGAELLVDALAGAISSPLGPDCGDISLGDISRKNRIDEMSFEFHLGEGGHRPSIHDIGRLLLDGLPPDDPFVPWAADVASGATDISLAGHLTGSIDAVIRVHARDGTQRFLVVDYKTNRLSDPRRTPAPDDYGWARMAEAMVEHQYPLQALIYSVALHRYLRSRVPGYDPAQHLGGAAYLFVRGMTGREERHDAGRPDGVFHWDIPPTVVSSLSDLLHGLTVTGVAA